MLFARIKAQLEPQPCILFETLVSSHCSHDVFAFAVPTRKSQQLIFDLI